MSRATYAQFEELVALVSGQVRPILPKPQWGQDVAFLAANIDGLAGQVGRLVEHIDRVVAACDAWDSAGATADGQELEDLLEAITQLAIARAAS